MEVITAAALSSVVQGELLGTADLAIRGVAAIQKAGPNDVTYATSETYLKEVCKSQAGACIVPHSIAATLPADSSQTFILVEDALEAFILAMEAFRPTAPRAQLGISSAAFISPTAKIGAGTNIYPTAFIDEGVEIGANCDIYPGVFIGKNCRLAEGCTLYPHAVLYPDVQLGARVIVHATAVLGADGFGYRIKRGRFEKIPQTGCVQVEDDCEIGASTTIDRGMIGATRIGEGTKLDNLIMIGHNCELGKHNAFASQTGLAGSVTSGDYVRCAGQVGIKDHVHLGTGSTLGAKAGVHRSVPAGETHIGIPAGPESEQIRTMLSLTRVPGMRGQVRDLEKQVAELTRQLQSLLATGINSAT